MTEGWTRGKTLERTSALRFVLSKDKNWPQPPKLQQAWVCRETGEVEWKDVEVVESD